MSDRLREHIIHLCDEADEQTMFRVVKLLESGGSAEAIKGLLPPSPTATLDYEESSGNRLSVSSTESAVGVRGRKGSVGVGGVTFDHPLGLTQKGGNSMFNSLATPAQDVGEAGSSHSMPMVVEDDQEQSVGRGRRIAVSAAPMQMMESFVPRVIAKEKEESEIVMKGVTSCHLFASMDEDERQVIVNALEKEEFPAGTEILTQGTAPKNKFYMIADGTCEVVKHGKFITSLVSGMTFGELELMYDVAECAATIRAVTLCVMYSLDQHTYQNIVFKVSESKRKLYLELLDNVNFLKNMPEYDRSTLADALVPGSYQVGDDIIKFGEKGQWMYIIIDGEVQVVGRDRGKKVDVIRLGAGEVVGELEFLFDQHTVADVVALTKVKTARINRKHFEMCMGPITEQLKQYVAKEGHYDYFLKEAHVDIQKEIKKIEKFQKRVANVARQEAIENVDPVGEVLFPWQEIRGGKPREQLFRFPLRPLQESQSMLLVGISEDGTIVKWNEGMVRVTNYVAEEAIGQNIYSFLLNPKDQQDFHSAVSLALKWAGNTDAYNASIEGKEKLSLTLARSDGLTKSAIELSIVPPSVAHNNVSEILLGVGHEVRRPPPRTNDYSHWVADQTRQLISDIDLQTDEKLSRIGALMKKFESLQRDANTSQDNLRVVNLRQLIGQIVMNYGQDCVERGHVVSQHFDGLYFDEVYCDATLLPECLKYALSNCANHLTNAKIRIMVTVLEEFGSEFLQITFWDNGPGFPRRILDMFNTGVQVPGVSGALLRVKHAIEQQGGTMSIESELGDSKVSFKVPFIPYDDADEDNGAFANMAASDSFTGSPSTVQAKKQTYTTLVVEEQPSNRNMLCSFLWERKHAVLPGYSWGDIQRLADVTDILVIDPSQGVLADAKGDPFALLREQARSMAIVISGENMDNATKLAYDAAGFFTLAKPFTAIQSVKTLRKAEEKVSKIKSEMNKIAAVRDTFSKTSRGEWKKGRQLGRGAFGEVYEAIDVLTGGKMAVKIMKIKKSINKEELLNEIEVMCTLQHANIIHYFYCDDVPEENTINIFMEYAQGGTLQGLLTEKGTLEFKDFVRLLRDVVQGVAYIHGKRYVHCDLKTANVLLNTDGKGKLGDFGTAKRLAEGEALHIMQGTPLYMAPECMGAGEEKEDGTTESYSFPADIWSLGCIALELATGKPPFSHMDGVGTPLSLMKFVTELTDIPDLSPLFEMPPSVVEFCSACLHPDPNKRATAANLLNFSIFSEEDKDLKTAEKALKRAQLIHVLNHFIAFEDPEERAAKKKDKEKYKTGRRESDFFDSDDSDEEEIPGKKAATGGDAEAHFFDSSEEEEEDEVEGKDQEPVSEACSLLNTDTTRTPVASHNTSRLMENGPTPGNSVSVGERRQMFTMDASIAVQEEQQRRKQQQETNTSSSVVPPPPILGLMGLPENEEAQAKKAEETQQSAASDQTKLPTEVQRRPSTTGNEQQSGVSSSSGNALIPKPPSAPRPSGAVSPSKVRNPSNGALDVLASQTEDNSDGCKQLMMSKSDESAAAHSVRTNPHSPQSQSHKQLSPSLETTAVVMHDVLLLLVDTLRDQKTNTSLQDLRIANELVTQYEKLREASSLSVLKNGNEQDGTNRDAPSRTRFNPNVSALLEADTQIMQTLVEALRKSPSSTSEVGS